MRRSRPFVFEDDHIQPQYAARDGNRNKRYTDQGQFPLENKADHGTSNDSDDVLDDNTKCVAIEGVNALRVVADSTDERS